LRMLNVHKRMGRLPLHILLLSALQVPAISAQAGLTPEIKTQIQDRCVQCHNDDEKNGGVNLADLIAEFDPRQDADTWIKVEAVIVDRRMPPRDEKPLSPKHVDQIQDWFEEQFVTPGGVQHAGVYRPRRLTREELQNTLEDILHVDIRETVTNSRLHVIPDTIIEKFFSAGVIGESGFSNDSTTLSQESLDIQTLARCFSLVLSLLDSHEKARELLFGQSRLPEALSPVEARQIINRFARRAFRRDVASTEVEPFAVVFEKMASQKTAYEAIKSSFLAILLSPSFLYRFENPTANQTHVSGDELAVRLSYFLWSAPPDATLTELAANGQLRQPDVLREQVRRMLADPRRIALAENIGGEWFDYKKLRQQSSVNKRSDKMAGFYRTQWEEALLFFDSILRYHQPIFSIVNADWAFTNRHQSGIYRLSTGPKQFDGVEALSSVNIHYRDDLREIRQGNYEYRHAPLNLVKVNDANRGGFLTIGPTLSVTSTPNRTSPIRRGVWVMERILGTHFEIPADVPDLEATQKKAESQRLNLSHTEILKLHSSQPGCASCHQYIDPIGFGLEVFDQLGISRTLSAANPGGEKLKWTPKETPAKYADRSWELIEPLVPGAETRVYFHYTKGRHRLNIRNVRLETGDVSLVDKHFGFTGEAQRDNVWFFSIPANAPKTDWRLTADVEGDGGTDSNGTITVSGPNDESPGHQLPNGKSFASPAELKQLLLADYRDQIIDNAVRRVLAYALGRKIQPIDRPAIREITVSIQANGYRMTDLIEAVALSYPFRHKEFRSGRVK